MNLMNLSAFVRRKNVDADTIRGYDLFLQWVPTLGMFIRCKDEKDILVKGVCSEEEWEKGGKLLVFNNFELDDYGEDYVCVTDGSCYLLFESNGLILDQSDGEELLVRTIEDLVEYELALTHPW